MGRSERDSKRRRQLQMATIIELFKNDLKSSTSSEVDNKTLETVWAIEELTDEYRALYA